MMSSKRSKSTKPAADKPASTPKPKPNPTRAAKAAATPKPAKAKFAELLTLLAHTAADQQRLAAILARVKRAASDDGVWTLELADDHTLVIGPPGDPAGYASWPASFRALIQTIGTLRLDDDALVVGEDADGGLDGLASLLEGTDLAGRTAEVRCPIEQLPNWWIYHPGERNGAGEPTLRRLDHGGGNFKGEAHDELGSLVLSLLADALGIDLAPAATGAPPVKVKVLGKLHRSINAAMLRDDVLFTAERPLKEELWVHYPDAYASVATYDVAKPQRPVPIGRIRIAGVPADLTLLGDRALVLCVDYTERVVQLIELDISDPKQIRQLGVIHTQKLPEHSSVSDCEKQSRILQVSPDRVLVRLYLNRYEAKELLVFAHKAGAWALVSEHAFSGVDRAAPFRELREGDIVVEPGQLVELFDREWGRLVVLDRWAVISEPKPPHQFVVVDANGTQASKLKFSPDGHTVQLTTWNQFVVVSSSKGISFLHISDAGVITANTTIKRAFPSNVTFSGGRMLVNSRFDSSQPIERGFCLELCSIA